MSDFSVAAETLWVLLVAMAWDISMVAALEAGEGSGSNSKTQVSEEQRSELLFDGFASFLANF